jgi:predicted nucleotidyltransferase component of viral defense system
MITEGYLARHYHGRSGGRDPALLDVAQDYALKALSDAGVFDVGLVFKGGTALRKFRAGASGRFSTDLDFAAPEPGVGSMVFEALHGAELHGVRFEVEEVTPDSRALLHVDTPLGSPSIAGKLEVSTRAVWLTAMALAPVPVAVHKAYEFLPVTLPVMGLEETIAEKLAAFRRRKLGRDLYDLAWLAKRPFDEDLVRQVAYLKVYHDVTVDGLGRGPFDPSDEILGPIDANTIDAEDIGLLAGRCDPEEWIHTVRERFRFLSRPTAAERRWAACSLADRYAASQCVVGLKGEPQQSSSC